MLAAARTGSNNESNCRTIWKWVCWESGLKAGGEEDKIMELLTVGKDKSEVLMGGTHAEILVQCFDYYEKEILTRMPIMDTEKMATKLADHQLEIWKKSGIDVNSCFELLELNKVHPDKLLRSPMLSSWINYAE
ncbi:unnamed protein product [Peronospora farinosa]|uniref:Uncharacterized protein n=1 Tax=Peronospora farinosa TaxID=134698 RepID=A0AAV0SWL8_9STRA|nr:unnamed protein product [Peronospora farinosa]